MGMKRVWLEWTNISVPASGRWELQIDQVLDCEDHKAVYVIATLSGTATGNGVKVRLYTTPYVLTDSVGSGRGGWVQAAASAAQTGTLDGKNVVLAALPQNSGGVNDYPPMGALSLAVESESGGTFTGNIRLVVCAKDPA